MYSEKTDQIDGSGVGAEGGPQTCHESNPGAPQGNCQAGSSSPLEPPTSRIDPRIDPFRGVTLRKKNGITREVKHVLSDGGGKHMIVARERHKDGYERTVMPMLGQWRRWAANAEVVA